MEAVPAVGTAPFRRGVLIIRQSRQPGSCVQTGVPLVAQRPFLMHSVVGHRQPYFHVHFKP